MFKPARYWACFGGLRCINPFHILNFLNVLYSLVSGIAVRTSALSATDQLMDSSSMSRILPNRLLCSGEHKIYLDNRVAENFQNRIKVSYR